jgi:diguanylate cyclase (GGDEF)-like protein
MRILIVDDEPGVHDDYARAILGTAPAAADPQADAFSITSVGTGVDAIAAVESAIAETAPFAVAFLDLQMASGLDVCETARRIRELDPDINFVIVTALDGASLAGIAKVAGPVDKVFHIAKPFVGAELRQTALALTQRWQFDHDCNAVRAALVRQVAQLEVRAAELAANESRAIHLATHDSLTDAPNRLAFLRALAERTRADGWFATVMIDLDRFKLVNDTLGHLAGDALIREICAILGRSSPDGALVARLGGDEFGVLFSTADETSALLACERMIAACSVSLQVFGSSVQGGASAGLVVTHGGQGSDPVDVMRRADLALNDAKRSGRRMARVFDESMDEDIRFRRRVESGLGEAIANNELSLVFQPIVSRESIEVVGFEALLRWNTMAYGPISPGLFMPIAEESNLIHDLGDWVLRNALAVLTQWPGQYVSVNFSPRQFRRHHFVDYVSESVRRAGVDPSRLQIEITETAIFDDAERAAETLGALRRMGFRIALDDFGTGYSSLHNIRTFALDCLKIDRSFIEGMGRERESAAIVHSIISLGRALGIGVIAEGVETEAQVQALRLAGASHLQGFFFSHPVPAAIARTMAEARGLGGDPAAAPRVMAPSPGV